MLNRALYEGSFDTYILIVGDERTEYRPCSIARTTGYNQKDIIIDMNLTA